MIITLEPKHIEFADALALRRQRAAMALNRCPHNGAPTQFDTALEFNRLGCRCECAAYLWLKPVRWHTFAQDLTALPDLHDFIDVKGRAQGWHDLIVQANDPLHWAYLLVRGHGHPSYELIGWLWGYEAAQAQYWADPTGCRPAYFVPAKLLRPIDELLDELRERQDAIRRACD